MILTKVGNWYVANIRIDQASRKPIWTFIEENFYKSHISHWNKNIIQEIEESFLEELGWEFKTEFKMGDKFLSNFKVDEKQWMLSIIKLGL